MPLTDRQVKALRPGEKARKVTDGQGLYVLVHPNGSRYWRLKYRFDGRERVLALGVYPDVSLANAREKRDRARTLIANGVDPVASKRAEKRSKSGSFAMVAAEWLAKERLSWAPSHAKRVEARLENDLLPRLGRHQVAELDAPTILEALQRVVARGAIETAHRELWIVGAVMRYAIATGRAMADPTPALRGALPASHHTHHAAIVDPEPLGEVLHAIEGYAGSHIVRCALRLLPHVFVRPGEIRHAEWTELDLIDGTWTIPASKMKASRDHVVPLSKQSLAALAEIAPYTGRSQWVFPSARSYHRPMSNNALTAALRRMGFTRETVTAHGFRATARTLLDEKLEYPPHLIEHQLAHVVRDSLGRAYNRTTHLEQRREMMQRWSDYLDALRAECARNSA